MTPGTYNATYELVFRNAPPNETRLIVVKPRDSCAINLFDADGAITNRERFVNPKSCPSCGTNICVPDATCQGDGRNTYACICPPDMRGDGMWKRPTAEKVDGLRGFDSWWGANLPKSFVGGTGCIDDEAPVITLLGLQRVDIPLCACSGCSSAVAGNGACGRSNDAYIAEVRKALEAGSFCAEGPPCLSVTDNRDHEISVARVQVDPPRPISGRQDGSIAWTVKYSVTDRSGNFAHATRVFTFVERSLDEHVRHGIGAATQSTCNTGELQTQIDAQATQIEQQLQVSASRDAENADLRRRIEDFARVEEENTELRKRRLVDSEHLEAAVQDVSRLEAELTALRASISAATKEVPVTKQAPVAEQSKPVVTNQPVAPIEPVPAQDGTDAPATTSNMNIGIIVVLGVFALRIAMA